MLETRQTKTLAGLLLALLLAAAGCQAAPTQAPPATLPASPQRPPTGPSAPQGERPAPPPVDEEGRRNVAVLLADLDSPDGNVVYHATIELLGERADRQAYLDAIDAKLRAGPLERQRTILSAIGRYPRAGRSVPTAAMTRDLIPLLAPFLGHADADLRREAVEAFAALDVLELNDALDPASQYVARVLDEKFASVTERVSAIQIVGRKPLKMAVQILIGAFERASPLADVREAARKELARVTGQQFRDASEARAWASRNANKTQDQLVQERISRLEAEAASAREAARRYWDKFRQEIATDPARYVVELRDALATSEIREVRIEAAKRLVETGRADAYDAVVAVATSEKADVELRRGVLLDAIARFPPSDTAVRASLIGKIVTLTSAPEKDLRFASVVTLGELKANDALAIQRILGRLTNPARDGDVANAALTALIKIRPPAEGEVGRVLGDLLERELGRPPTDPLRDARLIEQAAGVVGVLPWPDGSADAQRAATLLLKLLDWKDESDPKATAKVRYVTVASLGSLRRPVALKTLAALVVDADDQVATEACRALAGTASGKEIPRAERQRAITALLSIFDTPRDGALKDAALDAVRDIQKADPLELDALRLLVEKLAPAKDTARIVRLLRELPVRLPTDAAPAARSLHTGLRSALAEAYEALAPAPDPKAALEIWQELAKDEPDRFGERYADALAALPSERADEVYVDLLRRTPARASELWRSRIRLVRRFIEASRTGTTRDADRGKARALLDRIVSDRAAVPAALQRDIAELESLLADGKVGGAAGPSAGAASAGSGSERSGTTVPGGLKQPGKSSP